VRSGSTLRAAGLTTTLALVAILVVQELTETHPDSLEICRQGGLGIFTMAVTIGAAVAVSLRLAQALLVEATRRASAADLPAPPRAVRPPRRPALTAPGAGRAPPFPPA
jgi:hypothetical protein